MEIFIGYLLYLCIYKARKTMAEKNLNRLKVVLAEKNLSNKWLSEQLGVGQATISKWVTNTSQPNLEMLLRLSDCLEVPLEDLVRRDGLEIKKEETAKQSLMNKLVRSIPPKRHEQFIKEADEYSNYSAKGHGEVSSLK